MALPLRLRHLPPRLAVGAYILNSGWSKLGATEETAESMHGMASGAYPFLRRLAPETFTRVLATSEIALGAALLVPVVPTAVAGVALTGFAAGLVGLYLKTPGMRQEESLRPTQQGLGLAKDVWMLGIGLSFVVDDLLGRGGPKRIGMRRRRR